MLKGDWYIILGLILGLIGLVGTSILINYGWDLRKKELTTPTGTLYAPEVNISKPFEIQFGGFHYFVDVGDEIDLGRGIEISGFEYPFKFEFKDDRICVSAIIFNENNEKVAVIKNNDWTVNENAIIARDRNYNDYAFEVIDAQLRPRLQVIVKEQNKIQIGGYFYTENGAILATSSQLFINWPPEEIESKIERIFKYPSEKYLHQMVQTY